MDEIIALWAVQSWRPADLKLAEIQKGGKKKHESALDCNKSSDMIVLGDLEIGGGGRQKQSKKQWKNLYLKTLYLHIEEIQQENVTKVYHN